MGTVHYLRGSDHKRRPPNRRRRERTHSRKSESFQAGSVIPFPANRTANGRSELGRRDEPVRARKGNFRPLLVMLALGLIAFGLSGTHEEAWFSYLEVVLGVLGLIEAGSRVQFSRGRRLLLGLGAQMLAILAWIDGARGWLLLWTLAFGFAFMASARKKRERTRLIE